MNACVYVGTYEKYNNGNLAGAWLELGEYSDKENFYEACKDLHKDESDPEFMFQDWEGIPDDLIGESWIHELVWFYLDLDDDDQIRFKAWIDREGGTEDLNEFYD